MPKIIVLLADGTGNSAARLFKTNVWRLYRALDLADPPKPGDTRQIAFYHDGVGTSNFKPLALLGGIFGVGLKRNVIAIYTFLCRNYEPGDRIYGFGFSRGAFTIRVLAGLVTTQGILRSPSEEALARDAADTYRRYRRRYKLPLWRKKGEYIPADTTKTIGLVDLIRNIRDRIIDGTRALTRRVLPENPATATPTARIENPVIDFLGVWDTVAAYGLPVDELTRGIDRWVWPLSMPNYQLSTQVLQARHALALDEERDTFQPLLWDERREPEHVAAGTVAEGRLKQVWFPGVHSNVGGGYADDGLSLVPLRWMMQEAAAPVSGAPGLRFLPEPEQDIPLVPNDFGRLYNSRSGLAAYYRYLPRKISGRLHPPDSRVRLTQDPVRNGRGFLLGTHVHESVLHRIRQGVDDYAPIGLPAAYDVVATGAAVSPSPEPAASSRADRQEWVWNDVWRRRVNYFLTVAASLTLLLLPVIQTIWPPAPCLGPQCLLAPAITGVGVVLPGFLQPWITAFAATPGWTLCLLIAIVLLMARSSVLDRRIDDGMRELWQQALNPAAPGPWVTPAGRSTGLPDDWIYRLRTAPAYQTTLQRLKWQVGPGLFGVAVLAAGALLIGTVVLLTVQRTRLMVAEGRAEGCVREAAIAPGTAASALFSTKARCWWTGTTVEKGKRYVVEITVREPWIDGSIPTDPTGFDSNRLPVLARPGVLLRRSVGGRWFQPMVKVVAFEGDKKRGRDLQLLDMTCVCTSTTAVYRGTFTAGASGDLFLTVNDLAARLLGGPTARYYENNLGTADVRVTKM